MNIKCPYCGVNYEVTESEMGTKADCIECGRPFVVGQKSPKNGPTRIQLPGNARVQQTYAQERKQQVQTMQYSAGNGTPANGNIFSFTGRVRRSEYWGMIVASIVVGVVIFLIFGVMNDWNPEKPLFWLGGLTALLASGVFSIPVSVRRLHDRNMPGWWVFVFWLCGFIPFVNTVSGIAQFVILGCLDGTPGDNNYGPDPKGRPSIQPTVRNSQSPGRTVESPEDRLLKLVKLKEAGALTDEEYEVRRQALVDSLD